VLLLDGAEVLAWEGYGFVAPGVWTTNGSAGYTARLIANYVSHGSVVTESRLACDNYQNASSVLTALMAFWHECLSPQE